MKSLAAALEKVRGNKNDKDEKKKVPSKGKPKSKDMKFLKAIGAC